MVRSKPISALRSRAAFVLIVKIPTPPTSSEMPPGPAKAKVTT
jgi:hypothetical protein